jgi:hypothetical protein
MFEEANLSPCHYLFHADNEKVLVGWEMRKNKLEGKPLLSGRLSRFRTFTQMDCPERNRWPQITMIDTLTNEYPHALYILNTRDIKKHARSIIGWYNLKTLFEYYNVPNLHISDPSNGLMVDDIEKWVSEHNEKTRSHFHERPDLKFLEVDIEDKHIVKKLELFLGVSGLRFGHENMSNKHNITHRPLNFKQLAQYVNDE